MSEQTVVYDENHWFPTVEEAARFLANIYRAYDLGEVIMEDYLSGRGTPEVHADKYLADLAAKQILTEFAP